MKYKRVLILLLLSLLIYAPFFGMRRYHKMTDGFSVDKISRDLVLDQEMHFADSLPENVLNQTFTYLGKGGQSYAFLSEDKQYVLKFFKEKAFLPKWWVGCLPNAYPFLSYKDRKTNEKQKALKTTFNGYLLGYTLLKEETGLIFLQLHQKTAIEREVLIVDKTGTSHSISLKPYPFILQKYAKPNERLLGKAIHLDNHSLAKKTIDAIFTLYLKEYSKGVYDKDHGVLHNVGFTKNNLFPIHFDIGCLIQDEKMKEVKNYKQDLVMIAKRYEMWIKKNHFKAYEQLIPYIEEKLYSITGERITLSR